MIVELIRLEENFLYGTFGTLKINKKVFCVTLEPPDIENAKNVSCIPAQQYKCLRTNSPKYGVTFKVINVPYRDNVLFHGGNLKEHTKGCILLGQYWSKLQGDRAVLNSGNTFKKFLTELKGTNEFHLTIKEEY